MSFIVALLILSSSSLIHASQHISPKLEEEIFRHLTFPMMTFSFMENIKKEKLDFGPTLELKAEATLRIMNQFLSQTWETRHEEAKAAVIEAGILEKLPHQRMALYQLILATHLSLMFEGKEPVEFMRDNFLSHYASIGWSYPPYKP